MSESSLGSRPVLPASLPPTGVVALYGRGSLASEALGQVSIRLLPNGKTPVARLAPEADGGEVVRAAHALGLIDRLNSSLGDLTGGERAAAELLPNLFDNGPLPVDHVLDRLDPVVRESAWDYLVEIGRQRLVIVATMQPELAPDCDGVLVARADRIEGPTPYAELAQQHGVVEITLIAETHPGLDRLLPSIGIRIERHERGYTLTAKPDQEDVVRLLLAGYGRIEVVTVREPSPSEVLRQVLSAR